MSNLDFQSLRTTDPAMQLARAADIAGAVRLTDVAPTAVRWLWPGRIPLGRLTLLVSDPGLGKSLLALDIAARVSRGAPWPDANPQYEIRNPQSPRSDSPLLTLNSQPSSVLLLTAEDNLADTVRPRLEALGADCSRILAMSSWGALPELPQPKSQRGPAMHDVPQRFALNRDLARLANLLKALPDCRLIVIDPITEFLGGTNEQSNADVRALLGALTRLAREHNIAILIVSHLRKKDGTAIYRTMGSLAFVAAARAAWILVKDTVDTNKRLLLPLKNNLAPDVTGLVFTIEASSEPRTPIIRWSPESVCLNVDARLTGARQGGRPDDDRQHATEWLRQRLANGPCSTSDVQEEATAHGISPRTLRRAFRDIDGQAVREGPFPSGQWLWKLPDVDGQNREGEFWPSTQFLDDFSSIIKPSLPPLPPLAVPQLTPHT